MSNLIFTKEDWISALRELTDDYNLFVPTKKGDFHNFSKLESKTIPNFDMQNTRLSAKSLIYPQSERMFEFSTDLKDSEVNILKEDSKDYKPQAIVGIRHCDAHAFHIVKRNFDNPEYRDPYWVKRFESTLLIGLGCNDPCPTCFCTSVDSGPFGKKWLDALIYDLGDKFLIKGATEKGNAFLTEIKGGNPADKVSLKQADKIVKASLDKGMSEVPTDRLKEKVKTDLFEAPFWDQVAFACINCGTCTFLCPTCWCFDIQDEVQGKQGDRIRNWDSCMSPLFTLEGSGHNPRSEKTQRVRQRFMHKLKYYVDRYDNGVQCSGCGRCVRYCPVNIDIRQVAKKMNEFA